MDRLDGWRLVDVQSEMELKVMDHSLKPIPPSCCPNYVSIDIIPSSMVYSNTRSTFRWRISMIPTKGTLPNQHRVKEADGRYETIMDLMTLQDQIESFQKLIFASLRGSANNECKISALVPLVKESFGIYKFITSMLRAMHRRKLIVSYIESSWSIGTDSPDVLVPLRDRYTAQHFNLRRFYYECSNLKYLTGLINVPKLGQVSWQWARRK
jgi:hypothetical protein